MGFDNECILNIESLAGEYFCPVCRTLVYPNEAIQSQCTHLYCKPCLTYVVGTTHACPYDGYLVTEADSKPLIESNKALAETIGKIVVRCLYHRSGCSWQGPLSDCTSHCPGCTFGNSPVVCNRCGVQIVHRQVQEHAQTCSGVNPQAQQGTESVQDAANSGAASGADQSQATNQVAAPQSSQVQTMPAAAAVPPAGQVLNQQANVNPPVQAPAQGGGPTPEQWYQQQYQQNYQQYPGYDPYQQTYQQYFPYQQQPTQQFQPPHQPQLYTQPQSQPQLQPQVQPQPSRPQAQPQPQAQSQPPQQQQVPPHGQPHVQPHIIQAQVSQAHLPPPGHLPPPPPIYPQAQPQLQPHPQNMHVPQYQQPHSQMHHPQPQPQPPPHTQSRPLPQAYPQPPPQLQNNPQPYPHHHQPQPSQPTFPNALPQSQPASAHAVTGNHSYPQVQANQQMHQGPPQQPPMHIHPSSSSLPQGQMHGQFPQQPPQMPPQSNQQESALMASQGQLPIIPPAQLQQVHPPAQQPGYSVHPRPVMQQIQQAAPQQYVQQPFPGQALGLVQSQPHQHGHLAPQHPMQPQLIPPGPPQQNPMGHLQPQVPHGVPPPQSLNYGGRPVLPNHGQQSQSYPQSTGAFGVAPARPMSLGSNQPPGQLNYGNRTNNQLQVSSEQQFVIQSGLSVTPPGVDRKEEAGSPSQKTGEKGDTKGLKSETGMKLMDDKHKPIREGEDNSRKDERLDKDTGSEVHVAKDGSGETSNPLTGAKSAEIASAEGEDAAKFSLERVEKSVDDSSAGQVESANTKLRNDVKNPQTDPPAFASNNDRSLQNVSSQGNSQTSVHASHPGQLTDQGRHNLHPMPHQQGPGAPSVFQSGPSSGPASNVQLPGYPSNTFRPQGPGHLPQPGQAGPFHPNIQVSGFPDSGTTFGKGPGHFGHPQDHYNQGHLHAGFPRNSHGEPVGGPTPGAVHSGSFDPRSGIMGRSTPHGPEGQFGPQHPINPRDNEVFPNERQSHVDSRHPDSHLAGSFERGPFGQSSGFESNMQRFNGADERFKDPFPMGPNIRLDQGEFEKGLKRFPRPSHEGSPKFGSYFDNNPQRGFNFDDGMKMDSASGGAPSHFLPPYHSRSALHSGDAGERQPPVGFNENNRGRIEPYGFGRHHMETSRSPGREYLGIPPRGFGVDLDGQDMRGPHNLPHMGEPTGFGPFSGHVRRGELGRPGTFPNHLPLGESFGGNKPSHPRIGEPGFRSSYSLQEFPDDGRFYAGETDSFDKLRRRKAVTTGWCRICKVDCETVEGLDLHSQTREHQKVTMDMVISIKRQNAKKQKTFSDHSSFEEARKPRNPGFKNRGAKPK